MITFATVLGSDQPCPQKRKFFLSKFFGQKAVMNYLPTFDRQSPTFTFQRERERKSADLNNKLILNYVRLMFFHQLVIFVAV